VIEFKKQPGQRILDLGGGSNRHPQADVNVDIRAVPGVDFQWDLSRFPWPLRDGEFDAVLACFVLEHVPFPKTAEFLRETLRVLKPGGRALFTLPNTEAQWDWLREHPDGWDGKDLFTSASELLYGSQDMEGDANSHRAYFSPTVAAQLFQAAGFRPVTVRAWGERGTDLLVEAVRPTGPVAGVSWEGARGVRTRGEAAAVDARKGVLVGGKPLREISTGEGKEGVPLETLQKSSVAVPAVGATTSPLPSHPETILGGSGNDSGGVRKLEGGRSWKKGSLVKINVEEIPSGVEVKPLRRPGTRLTDAPDRIARSEESEQPDSAERKFDRRYFGGGTGPWGGYAHEGLRDFACHEVTARHVLSRGPSSVLELGCARGYILKRIQDAGIPGAGLEVSRHCYLTRVCEGIAQQNLLQTPWQTEAGLPLPDQEIDLCYSVAVLEHIPEDTLPAVIREMSRVARRGLHGIDFGLQDDGFDKTHCTLRPEGWWREMFARHAPGWPVEILNKEALESGTFPEEVLRGDGKVKWNLGTFTTQFHHGWVNCDIHNLAEFAMQNGYQFRQHDLRTGIPCDTGTVDLLFLHHVLEHFDARAGLALMRDCRRVLKPETGYLRLAVPNADFLTECYRDGTLGEFDEMNEGCASSPTQAGKLWELLFAGHHACYDAPALLALLEDSGFEARVAPFRRTAFPERPGFQRLLAETTEMAFGGISLTVDAVPRVG
jgi:predicted SAM-dependent methyltransferase